jgi:ferrous iron transport protein B
VPLACAPPPASERRTPKTVALVGNPNCGKTTLFNALTHSRYKVANYPGVTVDQKEGLLYGAHAPIRLVDFPGTYSLQSTSLDEQIVTSALINESERPDLVVAIVDGANLERNLFLVSELIDLGYPILLVVNMIDVAEKAGVRIFSEKLSRAIDLPVLLLSAKSGKGVSNLTQEITNGVGTIRSSTKALAWRTELSSENPEQDEFETTARQRYSWIRSVVSQSTARDESRSESPRKHRLDHLLTHPIGGLLILMLVFAGLFQLIFLGAEAPMDLISTGVGQLALWARVLLPDGILSSLIVDGVILGVGNVLVFVPQIAILTAALGILEDSGYLSRAAFLLDHAMRRFGLQGRSFIPLMTSFACAVPGILSTRSIPSRTDRLITILIAPLMSCSARLPVYAVLIGAFIPDRVMAGFFSLRGLVLLGLYASGIVAACVVGLLLKLLFFRKVASVYVMEIPPLRLPQIKVVLRGVYDQLLSFLRTASTIIVTCSIIVWFLASYPKPPLGLEHEKVQHSFAGQLGMAMEPVIAPLGFNWEIGFAILASFPAREVFVSSLSTVYNLQNDDDTMTSSVIANLQERSAKGEFDLSVGLALLAFYIFSCQCMSTLAVAKRETGSWGWTAGMFLYMTGLAYGAAFVVRMITVWATAV